jgi:4-oxalocrotonate tautomerase
MPLVRIAVPKELDSITLKSVSDSIHSAMVETITVPQADRFQIISTHDTQTLIYDPGFLTDKPRTYIVLIQIFLRLGRTLHQKRALYKAIVEKITATTNIPSNNIMITLSENDLDDWSFSDGKAQFIDDPTLFAQRTQK